MEARLKNNPELTGEASDFNTSSLFEVHMYFDHGDADSVFTSDIEVFLKSKQEWKQLDLCFKDKDVITDNYNTCFFEPESEEDRERGYTLN